MASTTAATATNATTPTPEIINISPDQFAETFTFLRSHSGEPPVFPLHDSVRVICEFADSVAESSSYSAYESGDRDLNHNGQQQDSCWPPQPVDWMVFDKATGDLKENAFDDLIKHAWSTVNSGNSQRSGHDKLLGCYVKDLESTHAFITNCWRLDKTLKLSTSPLDQSLAEDVRSATWCDNDTRMIGELAAIVDKPLVVSTGADDNVDVSTVDSTRTKRLLDGVASGKRRVPATRRSSRVQTARQRAQPPRPDLWAFSYPALGLLIRYRRCPLCSRTETHAMVAYLLLPDYMAGTVPHARRGLIMSATIFPFVPALLACTGGT